MQSELKPCPFCGGEAEYHSDKGPTGEVYAWVGCNQCDAMSGHCDVRSMQPEETHPIEAWNTRASDAEIARLTKALKTQAAAVRTLQANEQTEINILRAKVREAHIAIATLDSEREANARLTEELRAAEEREKALREALGRIAHRDPWTDPDSPERIAREALKEQPHADA